ncbi:MAG: tight adherence protein, partial [Acidobacteriota bacterium]|nr:tight adherence protein [Acidobacteriota bacterium]
MIFIITLSTFAFITLGVLGIYWLMFRPASAATERLRRMGETAGGSAVRAGVDLSANAASDDGMAAFAERMAKPFQRLAPPSAAEAKKLQKKLMQAGYRSPNAPIVYRAIQITTLIGYPAIVALGCALMARPLNSAILWILIAFIKGFFLPRYILNKMVKGRQQRVRWGLADALDLMVVSIEAGLGLNAAIVKVGEELREVHPDISEEFELTNLEIRVGRDRDEALR